MAVRLSTAFESFLATALPNGRSRVCVYMDDVRPGNVHRPEQARLYYAYYYQLVDLPESFRAGLHGWPDISFVLARDCEGVSGGLSSLTEQLLAAVDFPFEIEVSGRRYEFPFAMFMADEKAIKQMLAVKGAASYKPCCKCRGILGRLEADEVHAPFQHYTCPFPAEFDEYTYDEFCASCQEVQAA